MSSVPLSSPADPPRSQRPAVGPAAPAPPDEDSPAAEHRTRLASAAERAAERARTDDYFDQQPSGHGELPDPEPLVENLARCVIEVLSGARELEQLGRWVTEDVFRSLLRRSILASQARQVRRQPSGRPQFVVGSTHLGSPRDGVVEAVVVIHQPARSRAVAIRLEGFDRRWRASAIHVL